MKYITIFKINILVSIFIVSSVFSLSSQDSLEVECFSILVGKDASYDSIVLVAHNEDDWGDLLVNWYKVPAKEYSAGEFVDLQNGAKINQVSHTNSFLWVEMPGMAFSDSYMNEWGVTIASDQCKSREDKAEIVDGGIGFYLRRLMIERAKTAKEAVRIGGELIEKLGYNYSGRTYCIADPKEAWMMSVVKGKHWIAKRVPDDEIAIIPNCYTIGEIDLSDTLNYLGSKDIYDYAIERGWYNENSKKPFSFKNAYAEENTLNAVWNKPRFMTAINMLAQNKVHYYDNFPFSFKPKMKVKKQDLMKVLASHLEGTDFESCRDSINPHNNIMSRVCSPGNQYGFVAELRQNLPKEIAYVMWTAIKRPCTQAFIPWYFGIKIIPNDFTYEDYNLALEKHFKQINLKEKSKGKAYWDYKKLSDYVDKNYNILSVKLKKQKEETEKTLFENQTKFENEFVEMYKHNKDKAIKKLQKYEDKVIIESLEFTKGVY